MKMSVDRYDPVHNSRKQQTDDFLAYRLALLEGSILPHVAEIGSQQNESACAFAPQRFGGEHERNEFVVRPIERGVDDGRRSGWAGGHPKLAIGKSMQGDLVRLATPIREESRAASFAAAAGIEWQCCSRRHLSSPAARAIDHVSCIRLGHCHREIVFGLIEGMDSIKRIFLLDTVADLFEHLDARAFVDGCTGGSRKSIETQAIDAGDDAVFGRGNIRG